MSMICVCTHPYTAHLTVGPCSYQYSRCDEPRQTKDSHGSVKTEDQIRKELDAAAKIAEARREVCGLGDALERATRNEEDEGRIWTAMAENAANAFFSALAELRLAESGDAR